MEQCLFKDIIFKADVRGRAVDTKTEHTFTQFALMQRQNESYTDTKSGKFYVSSDKENWTEVGRFSMEKILDRQVFGVTPTKGRYFKVSIEESYRAFFSKY